MFISNTTEFNVTAGDAAGDQGYKAITKSESWGVSYYINGKLVPVLILEVGTTYKFNIYTGNDTSDDPNYHPFYITNDAKGNYRNYDEDEKKVNFLFNNRK